MKIKDRPVKVKGFVALDFELDPPELGRAIIAHVCERLGVEDDAGCDWMTDAKDNVYIGGLEWVVARNNESIAALINAANVLRYGKPLSLFTPAEDGKPACPACKNPYLETHTCGRNLT